MRLGEVLKSSCHTFGRNFHMVRRRNEIMIVKTSTCSLEMQLSLLIFSLVMYGGLGFTLRSSIRHKVQFGVRNPLIRARHFATTDTIDAVGELSLVEQFAALPTNENSENLVRTRHTASHVMAMAVQSVKKDAQITIGPWIDNGFYYDFALPEDGQIQEGDLKAIKKAMDKIIKEDLPMRREEVSREEARRRILEQNEPYKLEVLDSIKTEPITIYHVGDKWWDLCAGPHLETTGGLDPRGIELQSIAGAYWRGDENNAMLQRIYGTAWENMAQLKLHKKRIEEGKRRDHRTVGKKLDLFSIQEDAGK